MANQEMTLSVVMLPWLAHGHISPFLELAKKLAERNFQVYLCSTAINLCSIKETIPSKYSLSIQLLELHLPSFPDLPPHYHTTNGLPPNLMSTLKDAFDMSSNSFSDIINTLKPNLIIYDFNQPWAADIASSHNIPAVQFIVFGAAFLSFCLHMVKKPGENSPFLELYLHGSKMLKLIGAIKSAGNNSKDVDRFFGALTRSRDIILIRSFTEIEGKYIDYLSILAEKKIVPVGSLLVQDVSVVGINHDPIQAQQNEDGHKGIMQWLDKKDEASVVFVSFGSEYFLSKEEMEEVAHGLELSRVSFIWVIRFPVGEKIKLEEALPEGFFERVGERGIVMEKWAPQVKILEHSSTGGFVSHCGWGSMMESMKLGVPIIALPMHLDQPFNARLMEEVGVAVEVERDQNGKLRKEEIAQVIRKVVVENGGDCVRRKAREVSDRMNEDREIDAVVEELVKLCNKKN